MERSESYGPEPRVRLVTVEQTSLVKEGPLIRQSEDASKVAQEFIGRKDREHFLVLHLDGKHRLVSKEVVSIGTLSSSLVHPREVFKGAFLANAAAIICAHNHPSGDLSPSNEDESVFKRLKDASKLLGVPLLDFLIVSPDDFWSARTTWTF